MPIVQNLEYLHIHIVVIFTVEKLLLCYHHENTDSISEVRSEMI